MRMDFEELNEQFKYVRDSDQYGKRDAWYILKEAPYNGGPFYGSSMEFSDGDYLDFGNSEDFNFGSGDFTIELWRRRGDTGSTRNIIAV